MDIVGGPDAIGENVRQLRQLAARDGVSEEPRRTIGRISEQRALAELAPYARPA